MDKSGHVTRLTTNNRHEKNPALSPDGTRVAFLAGASAIPLTWEIYILDLETGAESQLAHNYCCFFHKICPFNLALLHSLMRCTISWFYGIIRHMEPLHS